MIIDSHIHCYDATRPQGAPWPSADRQALYPRRMPEDFESLAGPHGVTAAVIVEASERLEDNDWILDLAARSPSVLGYLGNLDITDPAFSDNLRRLTANPLFRGIRFRGEQSERADAATQLAAAEKLADLGLALDLIQELSDLETVAVLAESVPSLRIVVDHLGQAQVDGRAPDPAWCEGVAKVARHENTFCKVSNVVQSETSPRAATNWAFYAPTLDVLWHAFGEDRLMYGSDWPNTDRCTDYAAVHEVASAFIATKGESAAPKFWWRNTKNAYGLTPPTEAG